jgi:hypothetical protein
MTISNNFKCQLSFNWHLSLNNVCATQCWKTILFSFIKHTVTKTKTCMIQYFRKIHKWTKFKHWILRAEILLIFFKKNTYMRSIIFQENNTNEIFVWKCFSKMQNISKFLNFLIEYNTKLLVEDSQKLCNCIYYISLSLLINFLCTKNT